MKVMVNTNVILDVWLAREPHWKDSARLLGQIEQGKIRGMLCPTTVTTLHYLAKKVLSEKQARALVDKLLNLFELGTLTPLVFRDALNSKIGDFEDAVIEAVSLASGVDWIATRNLKDFKNSRVAAREPASSLE